MVGFNNTVGGHLVGYNGNDGIDLAGNANTLEDNDIGADADGANFGNGSMAVRVENAANNNLIRRNTISRNAGTGVRIVDAQRNTIRRNNIVQNGSYGIDLAGGGVTGNDSDSAAQPADYANRGQNFPILRSAAGSAHDGAVSGTSGTMTGDYAVDLNSSANCDESE